MNNDRNFKFALELISIIISVVSFALTVINESYVISAILFIASFYFIFKAFRLLTLQPVEVIEQHYEYDLKDVKGKLAKVKKTKILKINEANINHLYDHRLSASGKIKNIKTNIGKVMEVKDDGGTISVLTSIEPPLVRGEKITHDLEYDGINSFTKTNESVTSIIGSKMHICSIKVRFPDKRSPMKERIIYTFGNKKKDITKDCLVKENEWNILTIKKPKLGAIYSFEWEW